MADQRTPLCALAPMLGKRINEAISTWKPARSDICLELPNPQLVPHRSGYETLST